MTTTEEKIDLLVAEVRELQAGQVKNPTNVEAINTWSTHAEKFSAELSKELQNLTSHIRLLEATTPTASTQAPTREEGGRANGHGVPQLHQGEDARFPTVHHTLVKGEKHNHNFASHDDSTPFTNHRDNFSPYQHRSYDYKLPRIDFLTFEGEHPRVWRENVRNILPRIEFPWRIGFPWLP